MTPNDPEDNYWCAFQAYQSKSIIIEYITLAQLLVILTILIYLFVRTKRNNQFEGISIIYKFTLAWLLCFLFKTLINVIAYSAYIGKSLDHSNNFNENNQQDQFMGLKILSASFLFLDVTTTFFLQAVMIYIPYLWIKNVLQFLADQQIKMELRKKISWIYLFLQMIRKYLILRNIYLVFFLFFSFSIIYDIEIEDEGKYITIVSMLESIIILCIYPIGMYTFKMIKDLLPFPKEQQKKILIETIILMTCNTIRIILNCVFYFSGLIDYQPDKYCYDDHDANQTTINCLFVSLGSILMHILPGCMILLIYWPSRNNNNEFKGSLLISGVDKAY